MQKAPESQPAGVIGGALTKVCTKCGEGKPTQEFSGRSTSPDGLAYSCRACASAAGKVAYQTRLKAQRAAKKAADPEAFLAIARARHQARIDKVQAYRKANAEKAKEQKAARKAARLEAGGAGVRLEREKNNAQMRSWRARNEERCREYRAKWDAKNRDRVCHYSNKRRLTVSARSWGQEEQILEVYAEAKRLTELTGERYDVDHLYPIAGRTVSGLHVASNLRAIPSRVNWRKRNRLPGVLANELWDPTGVDVFHEEVAHG